MFAIIGATGNTGKVVAERLLSLGEPVRGIARSADALQSLAARGAETAVGDTFNADFLTTAFRGASGVYALSPTDYRETDPLGRAERFGRAIARAAQDAGVPRLVLLSSLGAEHKSGTGPIVGLHHVEAMLAEVPGLEVVALHPGYFYENFFGYLSMVKHAGLVAGVTGPDVPFVMTATQDIGLAAADALRGVGAGAGGGDGGTAASAARGAGRVIVREVLGPRDLTMRETTRIFGEKIGRPDLPYVQVGDADVIGGLVQSGISEPLARLYVEMGRAYNEGLVRHHETRHAGNTGATTFESFADALAAAYRAQ